MNKRYFLVLIIFFQIALTKLMSQNEMWTMQNSSSKILESDKRLSIGGYGQIDYNQPFGNESLNNGKLDVHRMVLLFGYRFTNKLQFVTEIEVEHVKEVFVEQAFISYSFNNYLNFRAGLMLVPMGIINEYHEPTTFNGVERPLIDKYISPTTWREIGLGFTGSVPEVSMKYQIYLMNGFAGYRDGDYLLSGKYGLRKGRQKGAESFINSPSISSKIEYYGILGLNLGLSAYYGKTQSTLYDGIEKGNANEIAMADSTVVGVSMLGFDARYRRKGFEFRGQLYFTSLTNTKDYNAFTGSDLANKMFGYYAEISYDIFNTFDKFNSSLVPFVRYSNYDTHYAVNDGLSRNDAFNNTVITSGLGWKIHQGVVLKTNIQFIKSKADINFSKTFNAGVAVWF